MIRFLAPLIFVLLLTFETRHFAGFSWLTSLACALSLFGLIAAWLLVDHEHPRGYTWRFRALVWSASILMGFATMFVLYALLFHVAEIFWGNIFGPAPFLAAAVSGALGFFQAWFGPKVRHVPLPVRDLHPDLDGLKIAQVSDLHVSATITRAYVSRVVEKTLAEAPDLIAVTGDLADGEPAWLDRDLEPLAKLQAPLGTYFVPGNHEYYWGAPAWIERTRRLGFLPLINQNRALRKGYAKLLVAGVPDPVGPSFVPGHRPDLERSIHASEGADFRILLAHRPGHAPAAAQAGFDLQLSGHTHAGQFFPFNLLIPLAHRHAQGLHRLGEKFAIYVNVGTGYWGPPIRFLVPAEITLLTLRRATGSQLSGDIGAPAG